MAAVKPLGMPVKIFGGVVSGLSISMLICSVLYLFWFVPLDRPGHKVATVAEIVEELKKNPQTSSQSAAELQTQAESVHSRRAFAANFMFRPFESILVTSTCLIAAFFAALYGMYQDKGEGKPVGSLLQPTLIGTVAGAVVLWGALSALVVSDGHAAEAAKAKAAKVADAHAPKSVATHDDHGHDHKSEKADAHDAAHDDHAAGGHHGDWRYDEWNYARLIAFLVGTVAAAFVGVLAPRGPAVKRAPASSVGGLQPAH